MIGPQCKGTGTQDHILKRNKAVPRRIHPMCPKCKKHNTYDIIPEIPNLPHLQLSKDVFEQNYELTIGNSKYYCLDCDYSWKKYRGKKVYDQIKVIHANSGGFLGPYFEIKIDLESLNIDRNDFSAIDIKSFDTPIEEKIEWFREELHFSLFVSNANNLLCI